MRQLFPSKFCWRGTVAVHRRHSHSSSSSSLQEKILASTITQECSSRRRFPQQTHINVIAVRKSIFLFKKSDSRTLHVTASCEKQERGKKTETSTTIIPPSSPSPPSSAATSPPPPPQHQQSPTATDYLSQPAKSSSSSSGALPSSKSTTIEEFKIPRITVIGVGGAGSNAVNTMIELNLSGVHFVATNTDAQSLALNSAPAKIQLGKKETRGLGAGSKPEVGKAAALESLDDVMNVIGDSNMLFITAGMGGGTGTGAAPIIAEAARDRGILTVAIVTTPFAFEGKTRMQVAELGISELEKVVDTLIVIPNNKLLLLIGDRTGGSERKVGTWTEGFKLVDSVLFDGVRSVTDLVVHPGLVNLDFADVLTNMRSAGRAILGNGEAEGRNRAAIAASMALHNPFLEDLSLSEAKRVLVNIYGGNDLTVQEVDEVASMIHNAVHPEANIIFGSSMNERFNGKVRVSLIITGMSKPNNDKIESSSKTSSNAIQGENKEVAENSMNSNQNKAHSSSNKDKSKRSFFGIFQQFW